LVSARASQRSAEVTSSLTVCRIEAPNLCVQRSIVVATSRFALNVSVSVLPRASTPPRVPLPLQSAAVAAPAKTRPDTSPVSTMSVRMSVSGREKRRVV
jgi:hypothetical protein